MDDTAEGRRLQAADDQGVPWRRWGPYLSDRQWGTVREDYSENGDAWSYFTHDQARSRAYRWGEDGIAGRQRRSASTCAWRSPCGTAPTRSSRSGSSGSPTPRATTARTSRSTTSTSTTRPPTPTCACSTSTRRPPTPTRTWWPPTGSARAREFEYELLDTGVFAEDRYFDVEVEYAKADPEDLVALITVDQPWAGRRAARRAGHASGSATPGPFLPGRGAACPGRRRAGPDRGHPPRARPVGAVGRRGRRVPLHRQRDQRRAAVRRATTARRT